MPSLNKPKIVYILPFYDEGTDTHLFYNYELIKRAARLVDIFVIIEKCSTLSVGQIKRNLGVSNCYVQKFSFPPLRFLELLFMCFRLRVLGFKNFYVHYSYYGALAVWLATRFKLWTSDVHRDVGRPKIFYWNRGMPWLFKRNWLEENVFKFILRRTILVTGPESLAKEYQKRYGVRKYRVLSNWVDVERFSPQPHILQGHAYPAAAGLLCPACRQAGRPRRSAQGLAKHEAEADHSTCAPIILFVHHLSKRKGADLVPEIASGFGEDILFLMAGDGPEREKLEILTHSALAGNVKLLGQMPNSEIPKYFHASNVFIMPSREEGSPHVLLEAMASGTPFVASDVGGVRELVPKELEHFLCKSGDVKCFQDKIKTLLSDKTLYDKARNVGLAHAKNFDISRGVEEFINLFK